MRRHPLLVSRSLSPPLPPLPQLPSLSLSLILMVAASLLVHPVKAIAKVIVIVIVIAIVIVIVIAELALAHMTIQVPAEMALPTNSP